MTGRYFTKQTLSFSFGSGKEKPSRVAQSHQQNCEDVARTPTLEFISDMTDEMSAISQLIRALTQKVGGSLMPIEPGG